MQLGLVHAQHHQLYVPYAYGAAYASIWESIFLDAMAYMFANWVSGVTTREAIIFSVLSTIKTNHDHCGYVFPGDPFVLINPNGPRFHEWVSLSVVTNRCTETNNTCSWHHQMPGFRYNFSSYLVIWDNLLGTRAKAEHRGKALADGTAQISMDPFKAFDTSKVSVE
jgi:sphinganine C4-monooxygenase